MIFKSNIGLGYKKAFSLLELIIVIAVIAAISAIIVPSMSNFSDSAKIASDRRNINLWNSVYKNLLSMDQGGESWSEAPDFDSVKTLTGTKGTQVPFIKGKSDLAGKDFEMSAPEFILQSDLNLSFNLSTNSLILE